MKIKTRAFCIFFVVMGYCIVHFFFFNTIIYILSIQNMWKVIYVTLISDERTHPTQHTSSHDKDLHINVYTWQSVLIPSVVFALQKSLSGSRTVVGLIDYQITAQGGAGVHEVLMLMTYYKKPLLHLLNDRFNTNIYSENLFFWVVNWCGFVDRLRMHLTIFSTGSVLTV